MQNHDWIDLLKLIPAEQHNTLILTTASGIDLNIEVIFRMEPSCLVFRGRVSGSTDEGRVFFLPFGQIDFIQINRFVKEGEIKELFERAGPEADGPPDEVKRNSATFPHAGHPSSGIYSATGAAAPTGATRPSGIVAGRGSRVINASGGNTFPAAGPGRHGNVPPAAAGADAAPAPRNSILERLRAQRNAILPPRPPAR
jgi:hypothetical protein